MDPDKNIILFNQIKKGSKAAFDEFFRMNYKPLCRYCFQFVKDKDTTEEVVQEFFVRLWEQREGIAIQKSLMAYLYVSVKNTALNYLQKKNTRLGYEQAYVDMNLKKEGDENKLSSEEIQALVQQGLESLPEKCRLVFHLSRYEGLTNEEIANYLNLSYKTVENQMTKAFHKLRESLKPIYEKLFT